MSVPPNLQVSIKFKKNLIHTKIRTATIKESNEHYHSKSTVKNALILAQNYKKFLPKKIFI